MQGLSGRRIRLGRSVPEPLESTSAPAAVSTTCAAVTAEAAAHGASAPPGPGAVGVGWDMALYYGLATHLASGVAVDPAEAEACARSRRRTPLAPDLDAGKAPA